MKAIIQERYGSPDDLVLRDVDVPPIGDDGVLVRVCAASVHADVWHVVRGRPAVLRLMGAGFARPRQPIPGTDMAGIVESVGPNVTRFQAGDEVFGETMPTHQWTNGGAFAEFVSVRAEWLALKPRNVTFEQAAAVPTAGFIALLNLGGASPVRAGQRVLVNGAAGGVGSIALQVAKACGAHVTGVDSAAKLSMLRALGADEVIDYAREDFTRRGDRYDLIFDVPGNHPLAACRRALTPDGNYVLIGHERFDASRRRVLGLFPGFIKLMFLSLFVRQLRRPGFVTPDRPQIIAMLRELLEAGRITPTIDSTYPLSETSAAIRRMVEGETLGRVIITV